MFLVECRARLVGIKFKLDLNLIQLSSLKNEKAFLLKVFFLSLSFLAQQPKPARSRFSFSTRPSILGPLAACFPLPSPCLTHTAQLDIVQGPAAWPASVSPPVPFPLRTRVSRGPNWCPAQPKRRPPHIQAAPAPTLPLSPTTWSGPLISHPPSPSFLADQRCHAYLQWRLHMLS